MTSILLRTSLWLVTAFAPAAAGAATLKNTGQEAAVVIVTERGQRNDLVVEAGGEAGFCPEGCFVRFGDGEMVALVGSETIEVSGKTGKVRD